MVFVFATGNTFMNANTKVAYRIFGDCTTDAWDYGTWAGEGDPTLEYQYTNQYFEMHCNEDGTYKNELSVDPGY